MYTIKSGQWWSTLLYIHLSYSINACLFFNKRQYKCIFNGYWIDGLLFSENHYESAFWKSKCVLLLLFFFLGGGGFAYNVSHCPKHNLNHGSNSKHKQLHRHSEVLINWNTVNGWYLVMFKGNRENGVGNLHLTLLMLYFA